MILVRSPLRITLGGGGTDLPSYSRHFGGFCLTLAIDKFVYVAVTRPFEPGIYLKYSQLEKVAAVEDVQHPIIREALRLMHIDPQIEITTLADIPAGTGLGSSSSFTTALLMALATFKRCRIDHAKLAALACELEIDILQQTIGKQDQYAASFGGLMAFSFHPDDQVSAVPLDVPHLADHLHLFFTGYSRASASEILASTCTDLDDLHRAKDCALTAVEALYAGRHRDFGELMALRRRKPMSAQIREWLFKGESTGAFGKLVGAGGGGFLLFYADNPSSLRSAMAECGLEEVRFRIDYSGTQLLVNE